MDADGGMMVEGTAAMRGMRQSLRLCVQPGLTFAVSDRRKSAKSAALCTNSEEPQEIICGLPSHFFRQHLLEIADLGGYLRDERGLVALAAMRHGRKVGRVGLDKNAINRREYDRVTNVLRL